VSSPRETTTGFLYNAAAEMELEPADIVLWATFCYYFPLRVHRSGICTPLLGMVESMKNDA